MTDNKRDGNRIPRLSGAYVDMRSFCKPDAWRVTSAARERRCLDVNDHEVDAVFGPEGCR